MKKVVFFAVMVALAFLSALISEANGVIPSEGLVEPFAVVDQFPTGTNIIGAEQEQELYKVRDSMDQNPNYSAVFIGTVSDLVIKGGCYVDPADPSQFSLKTNLGQKLESNQPCQNALALSRALAMRNWLIQMGIGQDRITVLDFSALTMKPGGNFPNQSVAVWMVKTGINISDAHIGFQGEPVEVIEPNRGSAISGAYVVPPAANTQKCSKWRWSCMEPEKKLLIGGVGVAAIVGAVIYSATKMENSAGDAKNCMGGACD